MDIDGVKESWYDPEVDILYLVLKKGSIADSEEIAPGFRLEYDEQGEAAGIEIHGARSRVLDVMSDHLGAMLEKRIQELKTV